MEFFLALTALAWLVPNHYSPWSSAWNESLSILGIILALALAAIQGRTLRVSRCLFAVALVCWVVIFSQVFLGKIAFVGDGVMAAFYVAIWFAAVLVGGYIFSSQKQSGLSALAVVWVIFALASVTIALVQWTDAFSLGIYAVEMMPGARPFGNVAQPNHLCTLSFLGLCGAISVYQKRYLGIFSFWLVAFVLLWGMVLTQSRTGWLQISWLCLVLLVFHSHINLRLRRMHVVLILTMFFGMTAAFGTISEWAMLSPNRSLADQMQPGVRLPYWLSMMDAMSRSPLFGYGWQQIGGAQQSIALDYPGFGVLFEHSHNFLLDLILWNGLLLGGLIIFLLILWSWRYKLSVLDERLFWLALAIGGIFIHSMLEFPLEYAYFLVPVGLGMGAIDASMGSVAQKNGLHRNIGLAFVTILALLFSIMAKDYLTAEVNYRALRLESARIGTEKLVTPAREMHVLTQLEALLVFARRDPTVGMTFEELEFMKSVAFRYGYPPVLFRYALAAGLNNQPGEAILTLEKICRLHGTARCEEAVEGWASMQMNHPQLKEINFVVSKREVEADYSSP